MDYENMSDYEIKATVLGFHPEHGELIAASEAKEAIAHFNDIAKAELAKANDYTAELEVRKEALEESLNGCTEKVLSLSGKLAKANERVAELESYNVKLANESHEYQKRVKELEKERETGYEVWQAKYHALKDSMSLTTCYECGTRVYELSPRSRCCMCEYGRAQFNERENEQLRKEQDNE